MNNETRMLTKREAAKFLGVCERTIDNYRKAGALACVPYPGRVKFTMQQIHDFIERMSHGQHRQ